MCMSMHARLYPILDSLLKLGECTVCQNNSLGVYEGTLNLQGWAGLQQELAIDMRRLWQRNLGRDDRLVADTSR